MSRGLDTINSQESQIIAPLGSLSTQLTLFGQFIVQTAVGCCCYFFVVFSSSRLLSSLFSSAPSIISSIACSALPRVRSHVSRPRELVRCCSIPRVGGSIQQQTSQDKIHASHSPGGLCPRYNCSLASISRYYIQVNRILLKEKHKNINRWAPATEVGFYGCNEFHNEGTVWEVHSSAT